MYCLLVLSQPKKITDLCNLCFSWSILWSVSQVLHFFSGCEQQKRESQEQNTQTTKNRAKGHIYIYVYII